MKKYIQYLTLAIGSVVFCCIAYAIANNYYYKTKGQVFRGYYLEGFEVTGFSPCGYYEIWDVRSSASSNLTDIYSSIITEPQEVIFIEVRGDISEIGQYGHLGISDRKITIYEVLLAEKTTNRECGADIESYL